MTDLRVLLAEAAPAPTAHPDFRALVRLGRRRNVARRIRLGLAALAVVAGVGGAGANVFAPASQPQQLSADRDNLTLEDELAAETPQDEPPVHEEASAAASGSDAPARSSTAAIPAAPAPADYATPATTVVKGDSSEGCELTGRTEGGVTAGPWYGNVSGWPTCTYRATQAGGYAAQGTWRIEIRRGGEQIALTSARDPHCAAVGVIQAGDEVTVTLANDGSDPDDRFIRVGPAHHC